LRLTQLGKMLTAMSDAPEPQDPNIEPEGCKPPTSAEELLQGGDSTGGSSMKAAQGAELLLAEVGARANAGKCFGEPDYVRILEFLRVHAGEDSAYHQRAIFGQQDPRPKVRHPFALTALEAFARSSRRSAGYTPSCVRDEANLLLNEVVRSANAGNCFAEHQYVQILELLRRSGGERSAFFKRAFLNASDPRPKARHPSALAALRAFASSPDSDIVLPTTAPGRNQGAGYHSGFISHSSEDKLFARRLHDALQARGVRCWFDEHSILPGDDLHAEIDEGVRHCDKLLLVCSEYSLKNSWWVDAEITTALEKEQRLMRERGKKVLAVIPLDLDGFLFTDEVHGKAATIRSRAAADFKGWETDNAKFEQGLARLVRGLSKDRRHWAEAFSTSTASQTTSAPGDSRAGSAIRGIGMDARHVVDVLQAANANQQAILSFVTSECLDGRGPVLGRSVRFRFPEMGAGILGSCVPHWLIQRDDREAYWPTLWGLRRSNLGGRVEFVGSELLEFLKRAVLADPTLGGYGSEQVMKQTGIEQEDLGLLDLIVWVGGLSGGGNPPIYYHLPLEVENVILCESYAALADLCASGRLGLR
jgi:hypothetical protein